MDAQKSTLISEELQEQLSQLFERLTAPVELVCVVGEGEKSKELAVFLNHLISLSDHLSCRFLTIEEDATFAQTMDAQWLPVVGVGISGELPRMVFHGIPGGKEMTSFVYAILNAGNATKPLDKYTMKDIQKIKKSLRMDIYISLACHHCAQLVTNAQRIAWENPLVTAHMIDANLYPDLVEKHQIEQVPFMLVNQTIPVFGGKTMAELTTLLSKVK